MKTRDTLEKIPISKRKLITVVENGQLEKKICMLVAKGKSKCPGSNETKPHFRSDQIKAK